MENSPGKALKNFGWLATGLMISYCLFKTMHWPGGGVLFDTWWYYGVFILTPIGFYLLFKAGKKNVTDFHMIIIYFLMGILIWGGIGSSTSVTRVMGGSFSKNEKQLRQSIE